VRKHKCELDVDFIGGHKPLTKEEETAISAFIKAAKFKSGQSKGEKARTRSAK
jgi:hypothetical protein